MKLCARLFLLVALCSGCTAGIDYVPVVHPGTSGEPQGIRYFESARYLLVYSDSKGGIKTQILTLPDQTRLMEVRPWSKGASLKSTLKFNNGMLTEVSEEVDSTATTNAILSAAQTLLPLLAASDGDENKVPAPYLYKIMTKGDTVTFVGGPGVEEIEVKLAAKGGAK